MTTRIASTPEPASDLLVLGLGSNLGDSRAILRWAIDRLRRRFGPLDIAPLYRTEPLSPISQPPFLNTVVTARGAGHRLPDAETILTQVKALERLAGRTEGRRFGPRPLDVDLLLYGDRVDDPDRVADGDSTLIVPHPRIRQRRFVLAPLNDLVPDLRLPPDGARVRDLLAALGNTQPVERVAWHPPAQNARLEPRGEP